MNCCVHTNNRIESFFQKMKSMVSCTVSLLEYLQAYLSCISILRTERNQRVCSLFQKVPCSATPKSEIAQKYEAALTYHAFEKLKSQLVDAPNVDLNDDTHEVSAASCQCYFWKSMNLPCKHILQYRSKKGEDMFCEDLVHQRWKRAYYKQCHRVFVQETPTNASTFSISQQPSPRRSQHWSFNRKFRQASVVTSQLAGVLAESGMQVLFL